MCIHIFIHMSVYIHMYLSIYLSSIYILYTFWLRNFICLSLLAFKTNFINNTRGYFIFWKADSFRQRHKAFIISH